MRTVRNEQQRIEMVAEIAYMYYKENLNLKELGKMFNISTSTVSRLIKEAHELKIVEVVIRYPLLTVPSLGKKLQENFNLKGAYVLQDFEGSYRERLDRLGQVAARVLSDSLADGMALGISLGVAVASTAKVFVLSEKLHCPVFRLQGANENELAEGTDLAQTFAAQLGGEFKIIPSPWIMQSKEACELILQERSVQDIIRRAENVDIALVGMGSMEADVSTLLRNQLISPDELIKLKESGAVGEICGKHYDRNGNILDVDFNQRTVSINIENFRNVDTVLGVAAGAQKVEAILGAIRGNLINILVTDSEAALLLLKDNDC